METKAQIVPLREATYKQFKEFLDSLDEERKSWSLDLQNFKNDKEFYNAALAAPDWAAIVCIYDEEIIGLSNVYEHSTENLIEVSFVVKKDYQSQGIGSTLLKRIEWGALHHHRPYKHIVAKHFKDNIASHKAFLKAGYKEWDEQNNKYNNDLDWKIKQIK